jgi:hypothetical protein
MYIQKLKPELGKLHLTRHQSTQEITAGKNKELVMQPEVKDKVFDFLEHLSKVSVFLRS